MDFKKSLKCIYLMGVFVVLFLVVPHLAQSWSGWASLNKPKGVKGVSYPAVGRNHDGRLEVFTKDNYGAIWHVYQKKPSQGPWSGWGSLGKPKGVMLDYPVVGRNQDGRLEVFTTSYDAIWHIYQSKPSQGPWIGWGSLGKPKNIKFITKPIVGENHDGRLEVFSTGSDRSLWHIYQSKPSQGPWIGWTSLGKPSGIKLYDVAVGRNQNGCLEVFATGQNGAIWHIYQSKPNQGPWVGWTSLGKPSGIKLIYPDVGQNKDGRLEVFAQGSDGAIWHIYQSKPSQGPWIGWTSLGKPSASTNLNDPDVGQNQDGRLEVFATGSDGILWHIYQPEPNKGPWVGWNSLGKPPVGTVLSHPKAGLNKDGRLEVFGTCDGLFWHKWQ